MIHTLNIYSRYVSSLKVWLPVVLGTTVLLSGWYAVHLGTELRKQENHLLTAQLAATHAAEIERRLSNTLTSTYILAQEIKRADGTFEAFDEYAESVLQMIPGITNLQLAPDGVITNIYPLEGNEKAIGHKILVDDTRRTEALLAIRSRGLTLAGPFELIQGGVGIIGRKPVFLDSQGTESFWGFTSALIMLKDLLLTTGLNSLDAREIPYQLGRIKPETNEVVIFSGINDPNLILEHSVDVVVPNGKWFLRVGNIPLNLNASIWLGYGLTLLGTILAVAFSYRLVREPVLLRKLVAEKTADLKHLAYHDNLTKLPNRHCFTKKLENSLAFAAEHHLPLTLMLIDLDQFKHVNDSHGHQAGDLLLLSVVEKLQRCLPDSDTLSRWGGDEFIAILNCDIYSEDCKKIASAINKSVAQPASLQGTEVFISASIGLASPDAHAQDVASLLRCADLALYEIKNTQRGGYQLYTSDIHQREQKRLTIRNELPGAIENNELEIYYQPIVCAQSGVIRKAEALLRWNNRKLGFVSPVEMIPVAEETGLIGIIGDWVFQQAAIQVQHWRTEFDMSFQVSVNVSPTQFRSSTMASQWISHLADANLDASSILVEITETAVLDNSDETLKQIDALRGAGFQLALDDFGTGYSSLSHLKMIDLNYIKIDREFISTLPESEDDRALCETIISIANRLDLQVVAEGVETDAQRLMLAGMGVQYLQGYLYTKPIPAEEFEIYLQNHPLDSSGAELRYYSV